MFGTTDLQGVGAKGVAEDDADARSADGHVYDLAQRGAV